MVALLLTNPLGISKWVDFEVCWSGYKDGQRSVAFSKHRPSGPMLSISQNVRLSVCLCVCPSVVSLMRYRLMSFCPHFPKVDVKYFLEIQNPLGKVMVRSVSDLNIFVYKWSEITLIFFLMLILPYKTWWKPHFPND